MRWPRPLAWRSSWTPRRGPRSPAPPSCSTRGAGAWPAGPPPTPARAPAAGGGSGRAAGGGPAIAGPLGLLGGGGGAVPGGARRNADWAAGFTAFDDAVPLARRRLLTDPMTSGGLLAAVPGEMPGWVV